MITEPGLLLILLYGTCTGYLIPKASPGREARGKHVGWQRCNFDSGSGSIPVLPNPTVEPGELGQGAAHSALTTGVMGPEAELVGRMENPELFAWGHYSGHHIHAPSLTSGYRIEGEWLEVKKGEI